MCYQFNSWEIQNYLLPYLLTDKAAIDYCAKREDIVVTKADKGGATVIMDAGECINKLNQQLKDENFHKKN